MVIRIKNVCQTASSLFYLLVFGFHNGVLETNIKSAHMLNILYSMKEENNGKIQSEYIILVA